MLLTGIGVLLDFPSSKLCFDGKGGDRHGDRDELNDRFHNHFAQLLVVMYVRLSVCVSTILCWYRKR